MIDYMVCCLLLHAFIKWFFGDPSDMWSASYALLHFIIYIYKNYFSDPSDAVCDQSVMLCWILPHAFIMFFFILWSIRYAINQLRRCGFASILWSFLSVVAAVVCCCWLLKFITHTHTHGPGRLSGYFMILRSSAFDLWILSAVEATEPLVLLGMTRSLTRV